MLITFCPGWMTKTKHQFSFIQFNTMKKILSVLLAVSILATACNKRGSDDLLSHQQGVEDNPNGGGGNNTTDVPTAVRSAFAARYANATAVQWKKLSDGTYKAEFFRGSVKWQAIFSASGTLMKEEHD